VANGLKQAYASTCLKLLSGLTLYLDLTYEQNVHSGGFTLDVRERERKGENKRKETEQTKRKE
jgi:hypothetical protein